jgi:hypothetical protein
LSTVNWNGNQLRIDGRVVAVIEPDGKYSGMWRVRTRDGVLSDMVNLSRAKDAAASRVALSALRIAAE